MASNFVVAIAGWGVGVGSNGLWSSELGEELAISPGGAPVKNLIAVSIAQSLSKSIVSSAQISIIASPEFQWRLPGLRFEQLAKRLRIIET